MVSYLVQTVDFMSRLFYFLILIRCFISWLPINRGNTVIRLIYTLTEPVLAPIRNLFSRSPLGGVGMGIDFSPIFAIILVEIVCDIIKAVIFAVLL